MVSHEFRKAMDAQETQSNIPITAWEIYTGKSSKYDTELDRKKKSEFISDAMLFRTKDRSPLFYLEVVVSQSWISARRKVSRILKNHSAIAVLVVRVIEEPGYASPTRSSKATDYIDLENVWMPAVTVSQSNSSFSAIWVQGHMWVGDIACNLYLFHPGWDHSQNDPIPVCSYYY